MIRGKRMGVSYGENGLQKRKVLWRSRRGTRELDMLLGRFISAHYETLSGEEKSLLDRLMKVEDPLLSDWLCHHISPPDPGMEKIVRKIRLSRADKPSK